MTAFDLPEKGRDALVVELRLRRADGRGRKGRRIVRWTLVQSRRT